MEMVEFQKDAIVDYLREQPGPVMEADLLKNLAGIRHLPSRNPDLFNLHFSLYHVLYILKNTLAGNGIYLHVDPMRIRLIPYPNVHECHHYLPERGFFCKEQCDKSYCSVHMPLYQDNQCRLSFDCLRDFYCNKENIAFGESDLLDKLMRGIIVYAFQKGEIDSALQFFDLRYPSKKIIQKKYYHLAMKYHPDRNNGDDTLMKKLNRSYQVLREAFVL